MQFFDFSFNCKKAIFGGIGAGEVELGKLTHVYADASGLGAGSVSVEWSGLGFVL
jgi:hypothetical protein